MFIQCLCTLMQIHPHFHLFNFSCDFLSFHQLFLKVILKRDCLRSFDKLFTKLVLTVYQCLLYEYRDLFIDMDVRNNRSELAIAIGIKNNEISLGEKSSFTAFDWTNDVFSLVKIYRSAF